MSFSSVSSIPECRSAASHCFPFVLLLGSMAPRPAPASVTTALAAVEDCDNCLDDDGDGHVDRADEQCAPPSNGERGGLPDAQAARAIDECSRALQRAGAKLARERFRLTAMCLKAAATCVQTRAADASCAATAAATCTRNLRRLAPARARLDATLIRNCSAPSVAAADLLQGDRTRLRGRIRAV